MVSGIYNAVAFPVCFAYWLCGASYSVVHNVETLLKWWLFWYNAVRSKHSSSSAVTFDSATLDINTVYSRCQHTLVPVNQMSMTYPCSLHTWIRSKIIQVAISKLKSWLPTHAHAASSLRQISCCLILGEGWGVIARPPLAEVLICVWWSVFVQFLFVCQTYCTSPHTWVVTDTDLSILANTSPTLAISSGRHQDRTSAGLVTLKK